MVIGLLSSLIMLFKSFKLPDLELFMKNDKQLAGEDNVLVTRLKSDTYFPFSKIIIKYTLYHKIEGVKNSFETRYSVVHASKDYEYNIRFDYCGIYKIVCEEIKVYDLFGLLYIKAYDVSTNAIVMPHKLSVDISEEKLALNKNEETFNDPTKGMDVSEIKELREYRDGDKLSQVHWKLSTKSEDLIVKEYERLAGACVAMACNGEYDTIEEINLYFDYLYTFGLGLLDKEIYFDIMYYDEEQDTLVSSNITNSYDFELAIQSMLFNMSVIEIEELKAHALEHFGRSKLFVLTKQELDPLYYRYVDGYNMYKLYAEK